MSDKNSVTDERPRPLRDPAAGMPKINEQDPPDPAEVQCQSDQLIGKRRPPVRRW
ncbi:MAG: hypothetical protein JO268_20835 [Pseudonocardiales bacterium]|nr:hypothetical protein [Pseudonocardiales bacterium]